MVESVNPAYSTALVMYGTYSEFMIDEHGLAVSRI
jgi:hypothetical protein